jgi:hypothetical protein
MNGRWIFKNCNDMPNFLTSKPTAQKEFPRVANFLKTTKTFLNCYIIIPKA